MPNVGRPNETSTSTWTSDALTPNRVADQSRESTQPAIASLAPAGNS